MVRARRHKTIFDKGYMPNCTKEHIKVRQTMPYKKGTKHQDNKLVDHYDEDVKGSWYPEKIQEISNNQYRIEKFLRKRTLPNGTNKQFIWWEGWPDKFNS